MTGPAPEPSAAVTAVVDIPAISRDEAPVLARDQYARFATELGSIGADDWQRATDCPGWTVRDMAGHVVGAMRAAASMRETVRQQRVVKQRARRLGGPEVDHMTALQIELTAALSREELLAECRQLVDAATDGRRRVPGLLRRFMRNRVEAPGITETWTLGYLLDTILTRDIWMHRVDLASATDRNLELDDHDRRIIADIVREWADRHGQTCRLHVTGPAGGTFVNGDGAGDELSIDAVDFCRTVSGRDVGDGLLSQAVPF